MTNEEAKDYIREWCPYDRQEEIIKALEQEPCEDTVSRQAVLDALRTCFDTYCVYDENNGTDYIDYDEAIDEVLDLPSVTPKQKIGRWIDDKCSVCGKGIEDLISSPEWYRNEEPKFCPYCGIKLEGESK